MRTAGAKRVLPPSTRTMCSVCGAWASAGDEGPAASSPTATRTAIRIPMGISLQRSRRHGVTFRAQTSSRFGPTLTPVRAPAIVGVLDPRGRTFSPRFPRRNGIRVFREPDRPVRGAVDVQLPGQGLTVPPSKKSLHFRPAIACRVEVLRPEPFLPGNGVLHGFGWRSCARLKALSDSLLVCRR